MLLYIARYTLHVTAWGRYQLWRQLGADISCVNNVSWSLNSSATGLTGSSWRWHWTLVQKYTGMAINTLSNRSKTTFKHFTKKHDEKLCILKMCRKKLQVLQRKESMAKSVLIRNTLKIVERQQSISDSFFESDEEKENIYIDTLLRELDDYNNQMSSSKPISTLNESVTSLRSPQTELIEDFHNSSTFSCNNLVSNEEDLSTLLELSQNQWTSTRNVFKIKSNKNLKIHLCDILYYFLVDNWWQSILYTIYKI